MHPIISIIVPVYNVEAYLRQCLDSILSQTFTAWELILVDDGSPDGSGAICDEYAATDERIHVLHIPNGGVSNARNVGMDAANGEWITFIDSDDWVAKKYLVNLYEPITSKKSEIEFVHGGIQKIDSEGNISILTSYNHYIGNDHLFLINTFDGHSVCKLYKKEIIKKYDLQFNTDIKIAEDYIFALEYILHVKVFCFHTVNEYYYVYRQASITNNKSHYRSELSSLTYLKKYIEGLEKYLLTYNIEKEEVSFRWTLLSNSVFNMIRRFGFWQISKVASNTLVKYIKDYSLIKYQNNKLRALYLQLFVCTKRIIGF